MKIKIINSRCSNYDNFKIGSYDEIKENLRPILSKKMYTLLNSKECLLGDLIVRYANTINDLISKEIKIASKNCKVNPDMLEFDDEIPYRKRCWSSACAEVQIYFCFLMGLQQFAESHLNKKYLNEVNIVADKVRKSMIAKYNKFYKSGEVYESFEQLRAALPCNN